MNRLPVAAAAVAFSLLAGVAPSATAGEVRMNEQGTCTILATQADTQAQSTWAMKLAEFNLKHGMTITLDTTPLSAGTAEKVSAAQVGTVAKQAAAERDTLRAQWDTAAHEAVLELQEQHALPNYGAAQELSYLLVGSRLAEQEYKAKTTQLCADGNGGSVAYPAFGDVVKPASGHGLYPGKRLVDSVTSLLSSLISALKPGA